MSTKRTPQPSVDFGYPNRADSPVPVFASIEEEAEFWDTHDLTDLVKVLERIEVSLRPELEKTLTLRLEPDDREELDRRAEELGVEPSTLVRMWVKEHLHKEAS